VVRLAVIHIVIIVCGECLIVGLLRLFEQGLKLIILKHILLLLVYKLHKLIRDITQAKSIEESLNIIRAYHRYAVLTRQKMEVFGLVSIAKLVKLDFAITTLGSESFCMFCLI